MPASTEQLQHLQQTAPKSWQPDDVALWCECIVELPQYSECFRENGVTGEQLGQLNYIVLAKLGIVIPEHISVFGKAIARLQQVAKTKGPLASGTPDMPGHKTKQALDTEGAAAMSRQQPEGAFPLCMQVSVCTRREKGFHLTASTLVVRSTALPNGEALLDCIRNALDRDLGVVGDCTLFMQTSDALSLPMVTPQVSQWTRTEFAHTFMPVSGRSQQLLLQGEHRRASHQLLHVFAVPGPVVQHKHLTLLPDGWHSEEKDSLVAQVEKTLFCTPLFD